MNRETHLKLLEEKMAKNLDVAKRKNSDYCGKNEDADPFANFRLANTLSSGRVSVEDSIFTRLTDKVARVGTLLGQDAQVAEESIQDALGDLSNYALILSNYLDSKIEQTENINYNPDPCDFIKPTPNWKSFKVGDKVLVKKGVSSSSELLNGRICRVKQIDSYDNYVSLFEEDGNAGCGGVYFNEITKV